MHFSLVCYFVTFAMISDFFARKFHSCVYFLFFVFFTSGKLSKHFQKREGYRFIVSSLQPFHCCLFFVQEYVNLNLIVVHFMSTRRFFCFFCATFTVVVVFYFAKHLLLLNTLRTAGTLRIREGQTERV